MQKQQPISWSSVFDSPIGKIGIKVENGFVVRTGFSSSEVSQFSVNDQFVNGVVQAIKNYFINPNSRFDIPLFLNGTKLQEKIWRYLIKIPVGQVVTYGELAKKLDTGPRVIGNACRLNPVPIIIPCHRVVAVNGFGGYCGTLNRVKTKQWLLDHENKNS